MLAAMQFAKVSFAFQALQATYGATPTAMGWILSTVGLVGLVLGVTAGLYAPALGYRRLLLIGMGLGACMALLQSLMLPFPLLWFTRFGEGISQLAVVVAAPTLIIRQSAPQHRSIALGLWSTFVGVAFAVMATIGNWVLTHLQLSGLFMGHAAGMGLLWLAVLAFIPKDEATTQASPQLADVFMLHIRLYRQWATALPSLCFFCYTVTAIALMTFVPQHVGTHRNWVAFVMPLMSMLGTFSAGWLAQSLIAPTRLVQLAFSGLAVASLGLGICLAQGTLVAPLAVLLMYVVGLAGGSSFALIPYLCKQSDMQARAAGAVAQMGNLGSTMGSPLFALTISSLGASFLVLPAFCFALLGIALVRIGTQANN
ncbi:MFS transporter [Curvibacter sp. CHRR-16]|uniref:MFS transporter n=1 Tax=Curvibacter sp. CHRR-16 TaxID=2835872 RepID=UPI001BDB4479|nr:MFS transporter [Curvibacter sp. CHRR-16]